MSGGKKYRQKKLLKDAKIALRQCTEKRYICRFFKPKSAFLKISPYTDILRF